MKTETLAQAIQFAMNVPEVQRHIIALEKLPDRFKIHRIMATVTDEAENIIRVFLNFSEKSNPNDYKEDALIDIQGTSPADFKVLDIIPFELKP
jgi:hypothetical protein